MTYDPAIPADGDIEDATSNEDLWEKLEGLTAAVRSCVGAPTGGLESVALTSSGFLEGFTQSAVEIGSYTGVIDTLEGITAGTMPAGFRLQIKPRSGHTIIIKHASASASQAQKLYLLGNADWDDGEASGTKRQWLELVYVGSSYGWYEVNRCFGSSLDDLREYIGALSASGGNVTGDVVLPGDYSFKTWNSSAVALDSDDNALVLLGIGENAPLVVGTHDGEPAIQARDGLGSYAVLHLNPLGGEVQIEENEVWHAGNDGDGSGLDADTLDGREAASLYDPPYIEASETQPSGTAGQALTQTTWTQRNISNETYDTGSLASIASSVLTLAAGTYEAEIICPVAGETGAHRARLYDTTGSATLLASANCYGDQPAVIHGRFTLGVASDLEIQHYVSGASVTTGSALTSGEVEVYTTARVTCLS